MSSSLHVGRVIFVDADSKFDFIHFLSICQAYLRKLLPQPQHGVLAAHVCRAAATRLQHSSIIRLFRFEAPGR